MDKHLLKTKHGDLKLPVFLPDATYGTIRSTSFLDVEKAGIEGIVTTTLHIEQKIGSQFIKEMDGIHNFFNWDKPILTDSGGWQVFSLINSKLKSDISAEEKMNLRKNKITELGCSFVDKDTGQINLLTPESSQVIQYNLGSDIVTVLDDPIIGNASKAERIQSVEWNTKWAKRSKSKFMELHKINSKEFSNYQFLNNNLQTNSKFDSETLNSQLLTGHSKRPLIGAVVQGADDFELRKRSAEELVEIGFDMYNFGGIPLMSKITWKTESPEGFYREMLAYVSEILPDDKYKYAMGIGQPDDIAFCVEHGWDIFDTVLPTRNARHGYLYVSEGQGDKLKVYKSKIKNQKLAYDVMHLRSKRYEKDDKPIDENCDCETCRSVSRAYLRHLIRINEPAGFRLATIHNLKFYSKWMNSLRTLVNQ